jgi:hypothetical protein
MVLVPFAPHSTRFTVERKQYTQRAQERPSRTTESDGWRDRIGEALAAEEWSDSFGQYRPVE